MENNSEKTAMSRNDFSGPMKWLASNGLIGNGTRGLDYGCGKGFDADAVGFDGWDPHHRNETKGLIAEASSPGRGYDVVVCIYVLNVIPDPAERKRVEKDLVTCLAPGGTAYVAVRNDVANLRGWTSKGTWQGAVEPHGTHWMLIEENSHFRLWKYVNDREDGYWWVSRHGMESEVVNVFEDPDSDGQKMVSTMDGGELPLYVFDRSCDPKWIGRAECPSTECEVM